MKNTHAIVFLLAAAASKVWAAPPTEFDGPIMDSKTGEWLGDSLEARGEDLETRCRSAYSQVGLHASCTPGACNCKGNNGCWGACGQNPVCQPQPNSGTQYIAFRDRFGAFGYCKMF